MHLYHIQYRDSEALQDHIPQDVLPLLKEWKHGQQKPYDIVYS